MSDSYEATIRWPQRGASDVIVTGSFDSWSCSHHLSKTPSGHFQGTVKIPWGETAQYKYIVDGRWTTTDDQPTELDPIGNLNNVIRAPASPPSPRPAQAKPAEPTVGKVNGIVETAKQAVVGMVEAIAPGTTQTPAETPVAEVSEPQHAPVKAALEEPAPAPEKPASESTESESAAPEITSEAVLPSEPVPVAPEVPVSVLPLSTEAPTDAITAPSADVSESKSLETTIVEGSATAETAVEPVPAPAPVVPLTTEAPAEPTTASATDVSGSKPLEATIVEGTVIAETAAAPAPAAPSADAEAKPSTHTPAGVNGTSEGKPTTNGVEPATNSVAPAAEQAPAAAVNGTNGTSSPKPANGTPASVPATPGKSTTPPGSAGSSPASTPAKEKRMRFPSLSSRSLHARSRSSAESAGEFGEGGKSPNGKDKSGTVASRLGGTERVKRRTSLFGKLKDVFHHSKHETSA
ncbi:hypothetical protein BD413DRAFT_55404 [Trametes elegans]|nr:hypothetical protein BD413DRAFT_55404 [Trametes elegans]